MGEVSESISKPDLEVPKPGEDELLINKTVMLSDDFENGPDLSIWSLERINQGRWTTEDWVGVRCLRIDVEPGDRQEVGEKEGQITERSEISERPGILLPSVPNIWYGFSFGFPENFPILDNRLVFAQWKQVTGGLEIN